MKQKWKALLMKMNTFFDVWDQMQDLNKHTEYDVARKMIDVIEKENRKKKPKLSLVKEESDGGPKAS
jgi:hypothetical protein